MKALLFTTLLFIISFVAFSADKEKIPGIGEKGSYTSSINNGGQECHLCEYMDEYRKTGKLPAGYVIDPKTGQIQEK